MKYTYIIEKAPDGSFSAYVPDLPGCTTSGDSIDEVRQSIGEAVNLYIESLREHGSQSPRLPPPPKLSRLRERARRRESEHEIAPEGRKIS